MINKPLLTLTGPSGSGKSTIEKLLVRDKKLRRAISHTTRDKRNNEIDGVDYYFISENEMLDMSIKGKLAEFIRYNGSCYGVSKEELDISDIIVIEPNGLKVIKSYLAQTNRKVISVYLDIDEHTRELRMSKRGDLKENIEKRIENDKTHFKYNDSLYNFYVLNNKKITDTVQIISDIYDQNK